MSDVAMEDMTQETTVANGCAEGDTAAHAEGSANVHVSPNKSYEIMKVEHDAFAKKSKYATIRFVSIMLVLLCFVALLGYQMWWAPNLFVFSLLFVLTLTGLGVLFYANYNTAIIESEAIVEEYRLRNVDILDWYGEHSDSEQGLSAFEKAVAKMMINNVDMISTLQAENKKDSRATYTLNVVMSVSGLLIVSAAVVLAVLGALDTGVALIAGIAGAITELASGIALVINQRATEQTSQYFKAMHENEKTLYAMNMILQIEDKGIRDETLSKAAVSVTSGAASKETQDKQ